MPPESTYHILLLCMSVKPQELNWYSSCHRDCELVTLPKITNTWFIFTSWHSVYKMLSTNVTLTTCNLSSIWKSIYTLRKLRVYCFTNVQALTLTCKCWCFIDLNTFRDSLYHLQLITVDLWSLSEKKTHKPWSAATFKTIY